MSGNDDDERDDDSGDISAGGSRILRHERREAEGGVAPTDTAAADAVVALFEQHLGKAAEVFHEIVSETVHVDVHVIAPRQGEEAWTLFTTGMSDLPMTLPDAPGFEEVPAHAELMIRLPKSWKVAQDAFSDEQWYWPVRWLKILARLPHEFGTWLGTGHTIPNGDPPGPLAENTRFCGFLIGPPTSLPEDGDIVTVGAKKIRVYALYPVFPEEMELKLEQGAAAVFDRLDDLGIGDVVQVKRRSVAQQ